jgi:hypothetical protein
MPVQVVPKILRKQPNLAATANFYHTTAQATLEAVVPRVQIV